MFEVDIAGLRQLVEKRGVERILLELLSNCLDEPGVTAVNITIDADSTPKNRVRVIVEDDAPEGFVKLSDAWTLFGDTRKRKNAEVRGRFNFGEKLVIAACERAKIMTTTGCVEFINGERHRRHTQTARGSIFDGVLRMSAVAAKEATRLIAMALIPPAITVTLNGAVLVPRIAMASRTAVLQTEVADDEGFLRMAHRSTTVSLFEPLSGEAPTIYEMGIPVVTHDGDYHLDVAQKVPLSLERNNVPPAYARRLRAMALNMMSTIPGAINDENAVAPWVKEALESPEVEITAVRQIIQQAYGDKVITRDPSDPEATKRCIAAGYAVIEPGTFSKPAWASIRTAEVALPAGRVMPTHPSDTVPTRTLDVLTPGMTACATLAYRLARVLLKQTIHVAFIEAPGASTLASWTQTHTPVLTFNVSTLPVDFFDYGCTEAVLDLLLHELSHGAGPGCDDHLSSKYHDACTLLGARLALAVCVNPGVLNWDR